MSKSRIGLILFCAAMVFSSASARMIVNAYDGTGIVDPARPPDGLFANTEIGHQSMSTQDAHSPS